MLFNAKMTASRMAVRQKKLQKQDKSVINKSFLKQKAPLLERISLEENSLNDFAMLLTCQSPTRSHAFIHEK
jgi:hypothetical protein